MRLAIFSDVHGNAHALQAVLADMESQGAFDRIIFAGDLVWGAARPLECIQMLQERSITGVYGNTDEFLWKPPGENWNPYVDWILNQIEDNGLKMLQALPFEQRISPTGRAEDELLIVHANPKNISDAIFPSIEMQQHLKRKISQPDSEVLPLLEDVTAQTIVFGHVHIPNIRHIGRYTLVNIASVSRPMDGDWRCKYGILTFQNGGWQAEHRYVDYDAEAARQAILKSDMPDAENTARTI
ncbi:MAG: metallophosphatase family protein [Anaerolineae bacterium]|nr:metallophosphatase family protein [Anaerolineae bacterium]